MLRLTGRSLAGGWNGAWYGPDPSLFRERLGEVEAALRAAGRKRSQLVASAGLLVLPDQQERPGAIAGDLERVVEAVGAYREAGCSTTRSSTSRQRPLGRAIPRGRSYSRRSFPGCVEGCVTL